MSSVSLVCRLCCWVMHTSTSRIPSWMPRLKNVFPVQTIWDVESFVCRCGLHTACGECVPLTIQRRLLMLCRTSGIWFAVPGPDPSGKEICKRLCWMCCVVRIVQRTLIKRFYIVYYVFNLEAVYLEGMGCGRNCFVSLFLSAFSTYQYL